MKNKKDMPGNQQVSFLDAPTIDCALLPSRKALEFRRSQLQQIIIAGDADYARAKSEEWEYRKGATTKNDKVYFHQGVLQKVEVATSMVKFMDTWIARRRYLLDDIRGLERSIALASD